MSTQSVPKKFTPEVHPKNLPKEFIQRVHPKSSSKEFSERFPKGFFNTISQSVPEVPIQIQINSVSNQFNP